jgi:hypothetical protein
MISPYKQHLKPLKGLRNRVIINRRDAEDVKGTVKELDDFGVVISDIKHSGDDFSTDTFIAYEDIRGVAQFEAIPV